MAKDQARSEEERARSAQSDGDGAPQQEPGDGDGASQQERADDEVQFTVGIGASAGGLEALTALIGRLGPQPNMALVVVQHLLPGHESALADILSRTTPAPVQTARDGMRVAPGNIYVIPPDRDLAILKGKLQLVTPPTDGKVHMSIDYFLRSLAADQGKRAIGIVLSGANSDGTFGLKAIKAQGGLAFVQEPDTAKYDAMPRSALESGAADYCLPPEAIADELLIISQHPYMARVGKSNFHGQESVGKLLILLRAAFGLDLSCYKPSTIERRIERRLVLHKIESLEDYVKYVQSSQEELTALYKDILISVTSFFRDHDSFEALKSKVFTRLLERKPPGATIRIWTPGCSTGEEAYSLAIALLEFLGDRAQDYRMQIFGTDVDEASIQKARRGCYPDNIALDVSAERLHRFFVKRDDSYQITRRVRDMIVFSAQNLTKDAPFSRVDLVTCRNLLIYLQPALQKKVLRIVHYALNPDGFLMLGTSETVGDLPELFSLIDRTNKIYVSRAVTSPGTLDVGFGVHAPEAPRLQPSSRSRPIASLAALADRKILDLYAPAGVLINENLDVLHFRGQTGPYLQPAPGAASLNILRLARPELHGELRRAIYQGLNGNEPVSAECRVRDGDETRSVRLEIVPLLEPETRAKCLLVLFHEAARARTEDESLPHEHEPEDAAESYTRLQELERELLVTREYLQSTIEELESANEELKSSNEELQSSNEELQSTNEELETSKEELQSANEELTTVNDELQTRMLEQQQTLDDLHNFTLNVDSAILITGMDSRIRNFTQVAERLFNLVPTDFGRSIAQLNPSLGGLRLEQLCAQVIESLAPITREVQFPDQRWFSLRVMPYRTIEHTITGAVVTFTDIDASKRVLQLGGDVVEFALAFLEPLGKSLMIINSKCRVLWASQALLDLLYLQPVESYGLPLAKIADGQLSAAKLLHEIDQVFERGNRFVDLTLPLDPSPDGERSVRIAGQRIPALGGESLLAMLSFAIAD